jgi:hypothetical protein
MAEQLSLEIADTANQYTATPEVDGSTSSVTYQFTSFIYDIDLEQPCICKSLVEKLTIDTPAISSSGPGDFAVTWNVFSFIVQVSAG